MTNTTTENKELFTPNDSEIIKAYCKIREIDNTIPDDVLNFMKDAALSHEDMYYALLKFMKLAPELFDKLGANTHWQSDYLTDAIYDGQKALEKANKNYKP